jgi:hypothetical protein
MSSKPRFRRKRDREDINRVLAAMENHLEFLFKSKPHQKHGEGGKKVARIGIFSRTALAWDRPQK